MADRELVLFFNVHRLDALEQQLEKQGKSIETEMTAALHALYEENVPAAERAEVESLITKEEAEEQAQREAARKFAVIHFHEQDDDYYFTSENRKDFYSAACLYRYDIKDEVDIYTLPSFAQHFGEHQMIDGLTFSVLCDAMPNDPRITAAMVFDFENGTVSVCESSDNAWWTYALKDVSAAVYRADRKTGLNPNMRREIFDEALAGKEIDVDPVDGLDAQDAAPGMQM